LDTTNGNGFILANTLALSKKEKIGRQMPANSNSLL
jgi:hypothetical protein